PATDNWRPLSHYDLLRLVHEIPLNELDAELPQHGHRVRVFDALGDRGYLLRLRVVDEIANALLQALIDGEPLHERAVDFDEVERQVRDQARRVATRAEVLEREHEARFAQARCEIRRI